MKAKLSILSYYNYLTLSLPFPIGYFLPTTNTLMPDTYNKAPTLKMYIFWPKKLPVGIKHKISHPYLLKELAIFTKNTNNTCTCFMYLIITLPKLYL